MGQMIRLKNITKRFGETVALNDVSLDVQPGELFALLGPNGAGKTTLVHILCTILQPNNGSAFIGDVDLLRHPRRARESLGVVFQEPSLDDRLTVYENLDFHGRIYRVPAKVRNERIDEMLSIVELTDRRDDLVRTLSGGQKRRLELARAMVHEPKLLFLDEPTVGLDPQTRSRLWEYVREMQALRGITVVVTTHYIEEVDDCDRVCIIDYGEVRALDRPETLKKKYGRELLRVVFRDGEDVSDVLERYGEQVSQYGEQFVFSAIDDSFMQQFLGTYADRIAQLHVEQPSLESVFLAVTGRHVREEDAGPRELLYSFARRGGEHTR